MSIDTALSELPTTPTLKETEMDYATKNTFLLGDLSGEATWTIGKGKSAFLGLETIYPTTIGTGEDSYSYWDIDAGAADDSIDARGTLLPVFLYGGNGNDTIYGSMGYYNHIEGGDGNDLIDARLVGSMNTYPTGNTELLGDAGADTILGGWGEDFIDGGAGRDTINAGDGEDTVVYDPNDISVEADGGYDTIDASNAAATNVRSGKGVTIDLSSNRDIFFNFEAVIGSQFNDTLTGDNANNSFDGGAGSDVIKAGGGDDFVVFDPNDTLVDGGFDQDRLGAENSPFGVTIDLSGKTYINFENIQGSYFDDVLTGDANRNDIWGNGGDDVIDGGAGYDYIIPGDGNDTWIYDPEDNVDEWFDYYYGPYVGGIDTIDASAATGPVAIDMSEYSYRGFENFVGSASDDNVTGNAWDNVIEGGAGADLINGGGSSGNPSIGDTASYAGSTVAVTVNLGTNTNSGGDAEGDQLWGINNLLGSQGDDVLTGDIGDNILEGGGGADQLDGGEPDPMQGSMDTASYARSASGVMVSLADPSLNTGEAAGDSFTNILGLLGSSFDDVLYGNDQDNVIVDGIFFYPSYYYSSNLLFGLGDDWIDGGLGSDNIMTGAGNDTVVYDPLDLAYDEGGRNEYNDWVNTFDTVDAASAGAGVTIDLRSSYQGFDRIIGSAFADLLTGNENDNVLVGGAGADSLDGYWGWDTADYSGSSAAVVIDIGLNTATGGDAEGDTFGFIENLVGTEYADTLTGDYAYNTLEGGAGADQLNGGDGADTASYAGSDAAVTVSLAAGTASGGDAEGDTLSWMENLTGSSFGDTLTGDDGFNLLEGGGGADAMNGGASPDGFIYRSLSDSVEGQMDAITGFEWGSGADVIDFSAIREMDYYADLAYYTTAFADFAAVEAKAEEVLSNWWDIFVATDGSDTYVFMRPEYDGPPGLNSYDAGNDMVIQLVGVNDLTGLVAQNFYNGGQVFIENLG